MLCCILDISIEGGLICINCFIYQMKQKGIRKKQGQKAQKDLTASTWAKDSHALYDYDAVDNKYYTENVTIQDEVNIYLNTTTHKLLIQPKLTQDLPSFENIYIASVKYHPDNKTFSVQSSEVTGMLPHPDIREIYPNALKNCYLVLKQGQQTQGYVLKVGNIIRLGRVDYMVIEIKNQHQLTSYHDGLNSQDSNQSYTEFSRLELNKGIHKVEMQMVGSCKICLCDESTPEDPLINPCNCKGSCELIHVGCLRNWINSKVKKEVNGTAISYNFSKFQCEICKTLFPKSVKLENEDEVGLIKMEKPNKPYVILESVNSRNQSRDHIKERLLHLIFPDEFYHVKIGRGHQCQIKISDISVSRLHAEIELRGSHFYLKDLKAKFGTLVKFTEEFELKDKLKLQYGRTCFDFQLKTEVKKQPKKVGRPKKMVEVVQENVKVEQVPRRARGRQPIQ